MKPQEVFLGISKVFLSEAEINSKKFKYYQVLDLKGFAKK
jgi:hypothetical protein